MAQASSVAVAHRSMLAGTAARAAMNFVMNHPSVLLSTCSSFSNTVSQSCTPAPFVRSQRRAQDQEHSWCEIRYEEHDVTARIENDSNAKRHAANWKQATSVLQKGQSPFRLQVVRGFARARTLARRFCVITESVSLARTRSGTTRSTAGVQAHILKELSRSRASTVLLARFSLTRAVSKHRIQFVASSVHKAQHGEGTTTQSRHNMLCCDILVAWSSHCCTFGRR